MPLPIFYIETNDPNDFITLNEDTSRHVIQVLRMKAGEQIQLTDGEGNLLTTKIMDEHKKKCTVRVTQRQYKEKTKKEISIAISVLKNAYRFEWFLEKATEVGVGGIIPMLSARTEKQHFRFDRMNNILVAAMLQSQQVWLPVLHHPTPVTKIITSAEHTNKLIAHCIENDKSSIHDFINSTSAQILIGPEGDFTDEEISAAIAAGYIPVSLGSTRLRTETAGVVAATSLCVNED